MLNQFQRDATQFKLVDIAGNIQKFGVQVGNAASYVDYTFSHLNRYMQLDQENDNHATFLFEYQALLRSRMQQMITDLTAALTRDLDAAIFTSRNDWGGRTAGQGFSSDVEDAGAARMAWNFFTGFASAANPSNGNITGNAYVGIPTWDPGRPPAGATVNKVSVDTQADATFFGIDAADETTELSILRVLGTATLQQSFPEDGLTSAVIDNMRIVHGGATLNYDEVGGGFIAHKNQYKFTDTTAATPASATSYNAQNIYFINQTMTDPGVDGSGNAIGSDGGNLNNEAYDAETTFGTNTAPEYNRFNRAGNVKNEFEKVLYDTIFELDQRNLLRDIMRLSEKDGFLNDIQIASTTSINTGTQLAASIMLNFFPDFDGQNGAIFRPDLGGTVQVIVDRFSAFYHS
ncbi:MAG: hypothetical protein ACAI44_28380 [Candidatus Sericytochromatia bacterium]